VRRLTHHAGVLKVAFAGTFAATLEPAVRARLAVPCEVIVSDEAGIAGKLADVDVLVTLAFTRDMATAATRLKLVQVPGAGLDRIDRAAVGASTALANVYGHEVGIAEYALGAMLALARQFGRLDAALRRERGKASGPWACRRHRRGPSWPARRSGSSATDTSARRWPGARAPST
jgi:phosphoglycerate dehydrogenase-like enzyme